MQSSPSSVPPPFDQGGTQAEGIDAIFFVRVRDADLQTQAGEQGMAEDKESESPTGIRARCVRPYSASTDKITPTCRVCSSSLPMTGLPSLKTNTSPSEAHPFGARKNLSIDWPLTLAPPISSAAVAESKSNSLTSSSGAAFADGRSVYVNLKA